MKRVSSKACGILMASTIWMSLSFVLLAGAATAGTIGFETKLGLTSTPDEVVFRIEITNTGDEAAMDLRVTYWVGSVRKSAEIVQSLGPKQRVENAFDIPISELIPGRYHLMVCLDYSDLNGYAMSSVSSAPFTKGGTGEPLLQVVVEDAVLAAKGELKARIKSSSNEGFEIEYQLLLPREVVSEVGVGHLYIAPGGESFLKIPIKNFSGLAGSEYAAFLIVEYESAQFHNSVAAPFRIRIPIEAAESLSEGRRILMWVLALGLLIVAIGANFWSKRG